MINDRPIQNPKLAAALNDVKRVMERYGFAGACMLVSPDEAAFTYGMHAPWSALRADPTVPLGFRFRAMSDEDGKQLTERRVEAALHTICQLSDFGEQTTAWMEDLKLMLRRHGLDFDHTPFGGKPLEHIAVLSSDGKTPWKTGDHVWITCEGTTVRGSIELASGNGASLMLSFEAILAGHVGSMPVLLDDDGVYRTLDGSTKVTVTEMDPDG
jgi:hypothetical protein